MPLNVDDEKKNVGLDFVNSQLPKHCSLKDDSVKLRDTNDQDGFLAEDITILDSESNLSSESYLPVNTDDPVSIERTKICVPLSIETKDANAFLLNKKKNFENLQSQTKLTLKHSLEDFLNTEKKELIRGQKNLKRKKIKNVEFEKREQSNRKTLLCCCLQTETIENNINVSREKTSELNDNARAKSRNKSFVNEPLEQKPIERKNVRTGNGDNKAHPKITKVKFDKKLHLDRTKHNIANNKSSISTSLEDVYKIFEYKMNIEIPKFNSSIDLWFLSKKFEEKGISPKNITSKKLPNFNETDISDIISETLSWYEIHKLNKIRKLENMLSDDSEF